MATPTGGSRRGRPFSNRLLDSVRSPRSHEVASRLGPSKFAASSSTRVVASFTSANSAPKIPAITAGRSASQIVSIDESSVRSTPSSVVIRSPSPARRTTTVAPLIRSRSKACSGWPVRSIT